MPLFLKNMMPEVWRLVSTLLAAGIITLVASSFTSRTTEQDKEISTLKENVKTLNSQVDELRILSAKQSVWNENVGKILEKMEARNERENDSVHKKTP